MHISDTNNLYLGKARDGLYEPVLADSEREAVADLLQYLENVPSPPNTPQRFHRDNTDC
jgi:hypothetical protein